MFKDYDIRGVYPEQINGEAAKAIAHAIVRVFSPQSVCICRDMRVSGPELRDAFVETFTRIGVNVADAGLTGTETAYFIAGTHDYDLVIMISASHNPPEYNGIKLVKKGPIAVTSDSGLFAVRDAVAQGPLPDAATPGTASSIDVTNDWRDKVLSLVDTSVFKPLTVVVDAGNGMAGKLVPAVFASLPFTLHTLFMELDGRFPNHVPNPLIEKNNAALIDAVKTHQANVGITFDGDADRMFLIDDRGRLVSGTITTALLAKYILHTHPNELILYNAICGRIVPETITAAGGKSQRVRVGHSYIKTYMREQNAIFAGEHSGHYYHRDFFYAESGVLTALMVLSLLSKEQRPLSSLVDELSKYPASSEINFIVNDIPTVTTGIKKAYGHAKSIDELDGVSVWFDDFWFNVRSSKTEPLLRLNMEADTPEILADQLAQVIHTIETMGGKRKE